MMARFIATIPVLVTVMLFGLWPTDACGQVCFGCCMGPPPTLATQFRDADAAVLAKWISAIPGARIGDLGQTTFEIYQVTRSSISGMSKGTCVTVDQHIPGKPGQISWLLGRSNDSGPHTWFIPFEFNSRRFNYVVRAPATEADAHELQSYYVDRLEDSDELIAADAFREVSSVPPGAISALAAMVPCELLRKWLADPKLPAGRIGLYSKLLGWHGHEEDVDWFNDYLRFSSDEPYFELEGIITGYLLLTGNLGLDEIDELKLRDPNVSSTDKTDVLQALIYLREFGDGIIAAERLMESVRLLIDQPESRESAIQLLADWKDWSVQSKLRELYDNEEGDDSSVKEAIIRYMIACKNDFPEGDGEEPGKHVAEGKRYLEELRKLDPLLVKEAEDPADLRSVKLGIIVDIEQ
jgi:hypothetical protein